MLAPFLPTHSLERYADTISPEVPPGVSTAQGIASTRTFSRAGWFRHKEELKAHYAALRERDKGLQGSRVGEQEGRGGRNLLLDSSAEGEGREEGGQRFVLGDRDWEEPWAGSWLAEGIEEGESRLRGGRNREGERDGQRSLQGLISALSKGAARSPSPFIFTFIRDPIEHFVSGYKESLFRTRKRRNTAALARTAAGDSGDPGTLAADALPRAFIDLLLTGQGPQQQRAFVGMQVC
jgi:hypothetical protein